MAELMSAISHLMYDNCSELPSTEAEVTSSPSLPAVWIGMYALKGAGHAPVTFHL